MRKLQFTLILTALLAATITPETLWTDEAFSAFMASHRTLASFWATLITGDSSDLQMAGYYLYLHCWTQLFGQSEIALRTANVPFMFLFSGVLVWASSRLFKSNWVWVIAALAPLAVSFSNDTRPYFDVIAMSLTCVACLLAYLQQPSPRERQVLPWIILLSLLIGATFHMLMLLLGPPLIVLLLVFYRADSKILRLADWKWPLLALTPVALALMAYFAFTFARGATYEYSRPDLMSMASVLFRFAGLSGFAPNRHYDISFRPYALAMALSSIAFMAGLITACAASFKTVVVQALSAALVIAVLQVFVLSFVLHQQIEFRHLSSLLPLLLLAIMAGLSVTNRYTVFAAAAIGMTWLLSDAFQLFSPDYRREDFRAAVRMSVALHEPVAVVADPIGAAYYGLDMHGVAPCFPLIDSCQEGFAKVPWNKTTPAEFAQFWTSAQIKSWLSAHPNAVVLISRSRHPSVKNSPWWPLLESLHNTRIYPFHGFYVFHVTAKPASG